MAGTLSAVLPGSGHASLGMWQSGFTSFFLVAVSVLTASEQYKNGNPMTGTAAALIGSVFYVGGIFSAATTAHEINDRRFKPARDEVRQWALPELQFEWTATNSPMSSRPDTAVRK